MRYRNKKNGKVYLKMADSRDCTNSRDGNKVTVYCAEDNGVDIFVRDTDEFNEKFELIDDLKDLERSLAKKNSLDKVFAKAVSDWVTTITGVILSTEHVPLHWMDCMRREASKIHEIASEADSSISET